MKNNISIHDLFCICNLSILYNDNNISLSLTDIETGKPIKLLSENKNLIDEMNNHLIDGIKQYIQMNNTIPVSVLLVGYFIRDVSEELGLDFEYPYIFWHIDDMCLYSFIDSKFQACKLIYNNQNDAIMFIDTITGNPIAIENIDKEFSDFMNEFINSIFDNDKVDYSIYGLDNILIGGDIVDVNELGYVYNVNDNLILGDLDIMYMDLLQMIMDKTS